MFEMALQDNEFLLSRLIDVIQHEKRHTWYDRTVEKAKLYTQLSTGEGSDELLKIFNKREDQKAFKQRVAITQQIHSSVVDSLSLITSKIPRSSGVTTVYKYSNDTKDNELEKILNKFNGKKSFDEWLKTRYFDLNDTDPNAFVVIEFPPTDGTKRVQPFPFEVSSEEAIFFQYTNNILQYLVVENDITFFDPVKNQDVNGFKWTIYGQNNSIKIVQVPKVKIEGDKQINIQIPPGTEDYMPFKIGDDQYIQFNDNLYIILTSVGYTTDEQVPAFRIGYKEDKFTKGETFLPHWSSAIPYLMKMVKVVSELDLTSSLHAFPQKISYGFACEKCSGSGKIPSIDPQDKEGTLTTCTACGGTKETTHSSSQDEIKISLPSQVTEEDIVDLSKLIHYVETPIDIIKWQDEYTTSLTIKCKEAVFNSAVWNKEDVNKTATGVLVNTENVNDSLYPYALAYTNTWAFGIDIISLVSNLNQGIEIITNVNKDLKLKTKDDYLNELKLIKDADGSQQLKLQVETEIMRLNHEDDADSFNRWTTKEFFNPYSGKSNSEVISITSSLPLTDKARVLWMDYGNIFNKIELEQGMVFYNFDRKKQAEIIERFVDERIEEIKSNQPTLTFEKE